MEQDATPNVDFLEPTLRTQSSRGRASSSQTSHNASSSIDPASQEMMDSIRCLHLRMDSQDKQLHEGQLSYIISWIHYDQGVSSSTPSSPPPDAQFSYFYLFICILFDIYYYLLLIAYNQNHLFVICVCVCCFIVSILYASPFL